MAISIRTGALDKQLLFIGEETSTRSALWRCGYFVATRLLARPKLREGGWRVG
jgi:hypothetical protein